MIFHEDDLVRALIVLDEKRPDLIDKLVDPGELVEPYCGVCSVLLDVANNRDPGYQAALTVLMFHDEPTYEVSYDYYLKAIGLLGVITYSRCLDVYAVATVLQWRRSSLAAVESPGKSGENRSPAPVPPGERLGSAPLAG